MIQHHYSLGTIKAKGKNGEESEVRPFNVRPKKEVEKPISDSKYEDMFANEGLTDERDEDY